MRLSMRTVSRADVSWDYLSDVTRVMCRDQLGTASGDTWRRVCLIVDITGIIPMKLTIACGNVTAINDELDFAVAVEPQTVVMRLGDEWEAAVMRGFAAKLRPLEDFNWNSLGEYLFGEISASPSAALRRIIVEVFGKIWARWVASGKSVTDAFAFVPDSTTQTHGGDVVPPALSPDATTAIGKVVSLAKTSEGAAAKLLTEFALKARYGIGRGANLEPMTRVHKVTRWYSHPCVNVDMRSDDATCPHVDMSKDVSVSAKDWLRHSDSCIQAAADLFGVQVAFKDNGAFDKYKTASNVVKEGNVSFAA